MGEGPADAVEALHRDGARPRAQVVVQGLLFSAGWQELKDLTRPFGSVARADIAMGTDGRSKGWGTVLFDDPRDAAAAMHVRARAATPQRPANGSAPGSRRRVVRRSGGRPLVRAPGAAHLGARGMPSNSYVGCGKQAEAQAARVAAQPSDIEDARACGVTEAACLTQAMRMPVRASAMFDGPASSGRPPARRS